MDLCFFFVLQTIQIDSSPNSTFAIPIPVNLDQDTAYSFEVIAIVSDQLVGNSSEPTSVARSNAYCLCSC